MARAKTNKTFRTFVKGLLTEASYLTYPEDYSTDELNTVLSRKGNRTRRLGINYENSFVKIPVSSERTNKINEFVWQAADNIATNNFLAIQVGDIVSFFSLEAVPVSDSLKSFSVNLNDYKIEGATLSDVAQNDCSFAAGKGYLFIVHPYTEPLFVEYNTSEDNITVTKIVIQMRDFIGLYDGLANDAEPTTLSKEHQYNLMNQGWTTPNPITPPGGVAPSNQPVYINPYTGTSTPYRRYNDSNENIP